MTFDLLDFESPKESNTLASSYIFELPTVKERSKRIEERVIDNSPFKILDAPGLIDDFYLNILDWSESIISIALGDTIYCYNTETKEVNEIFSSPNAYISSIKSWGGNLAFGDSKGQLYTYDFNKGTVIDKKNLHTSRISSIAFSNRNMSTGDKTGTITSSDLRSSKKYQFIGHTQEICGLKWSPSNEYLASGSNDNTVRVWRHGSPISKELKGHESAVKAVDWCPWKMNVLATGGGSKDKSIKFWEADSGKMIKSVDVNSQVCSLIYSSKYKEIITGHGFQENDIKLWKASDMKMISSFGQHENRILHMALSPDQCTLVSLGADESLKFWKISEPPKKEAKRDSICLR